MQHSCSFGGGIVHTMTTQLLLKIEFKSLFMDPLVGPRSTIAKPMPNLSAKSSDSLLINLCVAPNNHILRRSAITLADPDWGQSETDRD
jgi:hypothetical protein